jgi:two-component system phosphate regulon sensor histidine kinase PhoR
LHSIRWRLAAVFSAFLFACLLGLGLYLARFISPDHAAALWGGLTAAIIIATSLSLYLVTRFLRSLTESLTELIRLTYCMVESKIIERDIPRTPREVGALGQALYQTAARVQARLEQSHREKEHFATLLSQMVDALIVVDNTSRITMINTPAGQLFHLKPEEVQGRTFIEAVRDYELSDIVQRCLASGAPQSGFVETMPERRFLEIVVSALPDKSGGLAIIHDLTRLRRLETIRRDFVSNISHELRTPVSSIKALAETLRDGALEDPTVAGDFLEKIHVEADRLAQMVEELGELSRIESGQVPLAKKPLDIATVIQRAVDRMAAQAERAGLSVNINSPPRMPPVLADAGRIEQVLVNLLHNAIKFTPSGGRIRVTAQTDGRNIIISVSDTGRGISTDDLPRIFERFYKADKARSGGGTGLGLAIVKHIIEAHGGRIWAESREGQGATFHFTLSAAPCL